MIGIKLMGGLGNMMFQIAVGWQWSLRGYNVVYTDMEENFDYIQKNYTPTRHADEYKGIFKNFNWDSHKAPKKATLERKNIPYVYTKITPKDGVEYVGYFQSEKNFPNTVAIKWLFKPSVKIKSGMSDYEDRLRGRTCSIHVRRQDYLNLSKYHTVLDMDYYDKAVYVLEPFKIDRYLVFSDDLDWCREHFKGRPYVFVDEREYLCLFLMSKCTHNIIANSSLSWWGAWLGEKEDRAVICPKNWFGPEGADARDLIPERWIRL